MSLLSYFFAGTTVLLSVVLLWLENIWGFRDTVRYALWYWSSWVLHRLVNPLFTRGNTEAWLAPFPPMDEMFPAHTHFEKEWKTIRDEVLVLIQTPLLKPIDVISPTLTRWLSKAMTDMTAKSGKVVAKDGQWKSVLLRCYGQDFPEALKMCPRLTQLLNQFPEIKLCMISLLEPHSCIPAHRGPSTAVLRYHLPLIVPGFSLEGKRQPGQDPDHCKIVVGEDQTRHVGIDAGGFLPGTSVQHSWGMQSHSWSPGEGMIFSDVFLHSVQNNTDARRAVLFFDFARPLPPGWSWSIGSLLSRLLDKVGFHKAIFLLNGLQETTHHT